MNKLARSTRAERRERALQEFSPAMSAAIRALEGLIEEGVEFPDACWKIARRLGFTVDELRAAYDLVQEA